MEDAGGLAALLTLADIVVDGGGTRRCAEVVKKRGTSVTRLGGIPDRSQIDEKDFSEALAKLREAPLSVRRRPPLAKLAVVCNREQLARPMSGATGRSLEGPASQLIPLLGRPLLLTRTVGGRCKVNRDNASHPHHHHTFARHRPTSRDLEFGSVGNFHSNLSRA